MKLKPFYTLVAIAALVVCSGQGAFAQNTTISGQRLEAIEHEMFNDSNDHFIFIDLVMDGIVKLNHSCEFKYDNGVVYINDKKMSGQWQAKYATRFKEFLAYVGSDATGSYRQAASFITEEMILDPNSHFRKPEFNMTKNISQYKKEHPQVK